MKILACLLLIACGLARADMPRMDLTAGFHRIDAEIAANDSDRQRGLMQRTGLGPNQGMLFVFTSVAHHCMWMRNTLIPLSVAFLDQEGRILNIEDMQPQTESNHCAIQPARYALEMRKGWFAGKGIQPGARLGGLDKAPLPR